MGRIDYKTIIFVVSIPSFSNDTFKTRILLHFVYDQYNMQLNIKITKTVNVDNITYLVDMKNVLNKMNIADEFKSNLINNQLF